MRTGIRLLARSGPERAKSIKACNQSYAPHNTESAQDFCAFSAGAVPIFEYVHSNPALREHNLQFGYGMVQGPRRAVARFSGRSREGGCGVLVWITADAAADGGWTVRHCVLWGD